MNNDDFLIPNIADELKELFIAVAYILKDGALVALLVADVIFFGLGLVYENLSVSPIFYLFILIVGFFLSAVRVIKKEVVRVPKLELSIQPENINVTKKYDYYPIKWEKLSKPSIAVTRYNIFMKNSGCLVKLPFLTIQKSLMEKNKFEVGKGRGDKFEKTEQSNSFRVNYGEGGFLIKNEEIHFGDLTFTVDSCVESRKTFDVVINFGAMNAKEKEVRWKFGYVEIEGKE